MRPLVFLDVDGVVALEDPEVPVEVHTVSAHGRWRRTIQVPSGARDTLAELGRGADCVWASAWSHTAHPALRAALDLPAQPWPWVPVQLHKLGALRAFAAGRPWAWVDDGIDDLGVLPDPPDGVLVRVDPHRGITDVSVPALLARLAQLADRAAHPGPSDRVQGADALPDTGPRR